jgi:hypothetical protein
MRRGVMEQMVSLISLGDGSTLTLDFTTGVLDSRLSFSRSTGGSYVHSDGLLYGFDTSSSSNTIGTGSKTFTLSATAGVNRRYAVGDLIIASSGANNMSGSVTSYDPTTQALVCSMASSSGSGTFTTWIIGNRQPRFDHDPTTLAPQGLLVEGTSTNICLNGSMAYTATAPTSWVRGFSGCTVASVDSTTFPGQKAWSISATASGQRDLLEQVIALAANTTYTVSVYLEAVTGTVATFAYMTSLPAGATSNTVVNPSAGRISFTVTVAATAGNGTLRIGIGTATGTGVSADASVRFSHVQVETGSGASSYILTGASTATRNPDNCSIYDTTTSGNLSWFKTATQGTFYVEAFKRTAGTTFAAAIIGTRANSTQEFLLYQAVGNNWLSLNWGASEYVTNYSTLSSPFLIKAAVAFSPRTGTPTVADSLVSINGANSALNTTPNVALPFSSDLFCVGARGSASGTVPSQNYAEVAIRRIKFFPTAMTAAQLNAMTTL